MKRLTSQHKMRTMLTSALRTSLVVMLGGLITMALGFHDHDHNTGSEVSYLDVATHASNQSLFWGTYRSNLYFGLRPRTPHSLMSGLIWWGANDYAGFTKARHACDQGDGLSGYGWTEHDGRNAGSQTLKDEPNNIQLTTQFLKVPGGEHGGSWAVRLSGKAIKSGQPSRTSLLHYYGLEGEGSLHFESEEYEDGLDGEIALSGSSPELGDFTLKIVNGENNVPIGLGRHDGKYQDVMDKTSFIGVPVPTGSLWRIKDVLLMSMSERINTLLEQYGRDTPPDPVVLFSLPNEVRYSSNAFGFLQTYEAPFSVDIFFNSLSSHTTPLDPTSLTMGLEASSLAFHERFDSTYPIISTEFDETHTLFAKEMLASMMGGIAYFHGESIVDRHFAHDYDDDGRLLSSLSPEGGGDGESKRQESKPEMTKSTELFTATPSRSFFPRGFYWDEGFHLLLIGSWDNDLSLDILSSWVSLIDRDGWVAREQILGDEARAKVPKEFQVQIPHHANPPTLTIAVAAYIRRLRVKGVNIFDAQFGSADDDASIRKSAAGVSSSSSSLRGDEFGSRFVDDAQLARAYLLQLYPHIKRHYDWFRSTQRGQIREWDRSARSKTEAYRWRGRSATHVLTSGLDDYPRAKQPHVGELHVDLMSWMGFFTRTMKEIAEFVGEKDDMQEFEDIYEGIIANLEDLHWNEEQQMYCDVSVNEDDESFHVCHKGYISILPMMLQLIPVDSPRLGAVLADLVDEKVLWSEHGIRSLSKSDAHYGQGENYWRGPIWVQMNYLILSALHQKYAKESGPHQTQAAQLYGQLRGSLVATVFDEWRRTGFAWEQYDADTGRGLRSRPFTGWTSMVVMAMAEGYE